MFKSLLIWSNLPMLAAVMTGIYGGTLLLALMALTMMSLSITHHMTEQSMWRTFDTPWEIADFVFSIVFLLVGPYLLWMSHARLVAWCVGVVLCLLALSVYVFARTFRLKQNVSSYVRWHALWHISVSVLTTFIFLIYTGLVVI